MLSVALKALDTMCLIHLPLYSGDIRRSFFRAQSNLRSSEDLERDSDRQDIPIHSQVDPPRGHRLSMSQPDPELDRSSSTTQQSSSPEPQQASGHADYQQSSPNLDRDGLWTTTLVWKSFGIQEQEKFTKLKLDHHRQSYAVANPPTIPSTFAEFIAYRLDVLENDIKALKSAIESKETRLAVREETAVKIMPAFGGKNIQEATEILERAIRPTTASERSESKELYADAEFVATAEHWIGASLLKEL